MSTIQKAFIFIVLVLALLTAAVNLVLFAQRTNWKEETKKAQDTLRTESAKADAEKARLTTDLSAQKAEALNLQTQLANVTTDLKNVTGDLEATRADKATLVGLTEDLKAKVDILSKNVEAQGQRTADLEKAKQDAEAKLEEVKAAAQNAEEQLAIANRKNKDFALKIDTMTEQLTARDEETKNLKQQVEVLRAFAPGVTVPTTASVGQKVYGTVTGISDDGNVVYLSLGSDDGVGEGNIFLVYKNDGTYVAQAKVYDVAAKKSAARILPPVVGTVVEGDNVVNK